MKKKYRKMTMGVVLPVIAGIALFYAEKYIEPPNKELKFDISYVYRSGGKGQFLPLKDGGTLRSGDQYKIIFTPKENCYVYMFQLDSAEKVYALFPLESFNGVPLKLFNPVQKGRDYHVPASEKSFVLDRQTGTETIYFLAFRERADDLERLYEEMLTAQKQKNPEQINVTQVMLVQFIEDKGIAKIVEDSSGKDSVSWHEDGQTFSALRRHLEGMCSGCVNVLRFVHQ